MAARTCGRYSAEARAVAAVAAAIEPEPASLSDVAGLLARRADADDQFASGFVPWLAVARILLSDAGDRR